jgi:hypothetical protein
MASTSCVSFMVLFLPENISGAQAGALQAHSDPSQHLFSFATHRLHEMASPVETKPRIDFPALKRS